MSLFRTKKKLNASPFYVDRIERGKCRLEREGRGDCEKPFFEMKLNFAAGAVVPLKLSRLFQTDPLKNSTTIGVSYDHNLVSYTHTRTHTHVHTHTFTFTYTYTLLKL